MNAGEGGVSVSGRKPHDASALSPAGSAPLLTEDGGISFLALGSVLLRWRRVIIALGIVAAGIGLAHALTRPRLYVSTGTFVPRGSQTTPSGLAMAASQFGINIGASGSDWSPAMYIELMRSRALLEPMVFDTFVVAEQDSQRVALMDLLKIATPSRERAVQAVVGGLRGMIAPEEARRLGGVTVRVQTKWPSVSHALATRLLDRVNEFNLQTRKSQAVAERQFVEGQAQEAERSLRAAENRLEAFLLANRAIEGSPGLRFEQERLQREVARESQLYTSWLQSREEARIREIRDIPVITVMEAPRMPLREESRKVLLKTLAGAIGGLTLGALIAFLSEAFSRARRHQDDDAREFFDLLESAKPRFVRRKTSR